MSFPQYHRRRIRTTQCVGTVERRFAGEERSDSVFPNINSITRIIGLLMEKKTLVAGFSTKIFKI
ncbi:hypothetical protein [Enterococcus faecium]|uniref:hypothetical protein n=1 Tax=Enterococcus faecium TaxID=1352 RepID=UPI003C78FF89